MAEKKWKKLGGDFPPSIFLKEGESVSGVLRQKKTIKDSEGKERKIYVLDVKGEEKTLWGSGLLDHLLDGVKENSEIRVKFLGKEKVKIDGKFRLCNQHEVEVAE